MKMRALGNTGVSVSEIGLGCNRLGEERTASRSHWVGLVQLAADLGVNLFDTAEAYNWGDSESVLGEALANRSDILIADKMSGKRGQKESDFSAARMQRCCERSLQRLKRDRIDIYQLHSPKKEDLDRFDWVEGMERLKGQGKIRWPAVAVNTAEDGIHVLENFPSARVLQITYNILDRSAEERLFDLAASKGVALLGRMPLARGALTGKFRSPEDIGEDHRMRLDRKKAERNLSRVAKLRSLAESHKGGMPRLALHYALLPRAISALIPGARDEAQLRANVAASEGEGIDPELKREIDQLIADA